MKGFATGDSSAVLQDAAGSTTSAGVVLLIRRQSCRLHRTVQRVLPVPSTAKNAA